MRTIKLSPDEWKQDRDLHLYVASTDANYVDAIVKPLTKGGYGIFLPSPLGWSGDLIYDKLYEGLRFSRIVVASGGPGSFKAYGSAYLFVEKDHKWGGGHRNCAEFSS